MITPTTVRVFAPAKVNLSLHVTGQRADGYHVLDSLVAFADVGDDLVLHTNTHSVLQIHGPEAGSVPNDASNLVLKAACLFPQIPDVAFSLTKNLPVASGIGGGSADAAAAVRGLNALMQTDAAGDDPYVISDAVQAAVLALGADIPMCLASQAARIGGIGDVIVPMPDLPVLHAVLVNPRATVSTPAVFRALKTRDGARMAEVLPCFDVATDLIDWLTLQRNDLEDAAMALEPAIAAVKSALQPIKGCRLARMSGSGATCFGLFETEDAALAARDILQQAHPGWWVRAAQLGSQTGLAQPRIS